MEVQANVGHRCPTAVKAQSLARTVLSCGVQILALSIKNMKQRSDLAKYATALGKVDVVCPFCGRTMKLRNQM